MVGQLLRLVRPAQMSIWTEIVICIGVGVCFGYYVPFLNLLAPARVWTNDRGLHRKYLMADKVAVESWPWEKIQGYKIERVMYSGRAFDELQVDLGGREPLRIGLSGKQLQSEFAEVLRK